MQRIMVPLDGGPFAQQALEVAVDIARSNQARLDIVTVHAPLPPMAPEEPLDRIEAIHAALRGQLETYAGDLAAAISRDRGVTAVATVLDGDPATELERFAAAGKVDLVVMCTHGRGPVARAWLGSVADRLLRSFYGQLLLLRPDGGQKSGSRFRVILVALDGGALAETAIPAARALLAPGGTLVLARCVAPPVIAPLAFEMPVLPPMVSAGELRDAAEKYLLDQRARSAAAGMTVRTALGESVNTADWLVDRAKMEGADLIAISTHGRKGLSRLVLGSVADKVIRSAAVPVLACHPDDPTGERAGRSGQLTAAAGKKRRAQSAT